MSVRTIACFTFVLMSVARPLKALDSGQVLFYAPFDGNVSARMAKGNHAASDGLHPQFVEGIRGQAIRLGASAWGDTRELPIVNMPVDVGLWRKYGNKESLGPLAYPAQGNINDQEGTMSLWYSPRGWEIPNARDHFVVNLGMADSLALTYFTYFGCLSFQNSVGENRYKRCIGYVPPDTLFTSPNGDRWTHLTFSWRDDFMKLWINGKPLATEKEEIVPLRNPTGKMRFGSGDHQEAAFDDVIVLAQAVGDPDARALFRRNIPSEESACLAVPAMKTPTIDGAVTSETEWQGAASICAWADSLLGVANQDPTTVMVGHDTSSMYVAFVFPIPEKFRAEKTRYVGSPLKVTASERDGDLSQDDYAGVYLCPPESKDIYFIGINGGGAIRDDRSGDVSWNSDCIVKQSWDENRWVVEFGIPLASLAGTMHAGDWGVNFVHNARQVEVFDSICFFQPADIRPVAKMTLSAGKIVPRIGSTGDLSEGAFALRGSIANMGTDSFRGESEVALREDGKVLFGPIKQSLDIPAGETKPFTCDSTLSHPVCGDAVVHIRDNAGQSVLRYVLPFVFSRELKLEGQYVPTPQILHTVIDFGSTATLSKATAGEVKVVAAGTTQPLITKPLVAFTRVREICDLDCRKLPVGEYDVLVTLKVGDADVTLKDRFAKPTSPAWLGNRLGITEQVPTPWSPVKLSGTRVSCWGRTYSLGTGGLPAQVNILGQNVLAGSTRIVLTCGGKTQSFPSGLVQATQKKSGRASFLSTTETRGVRWDNSGWVEFDGFCWNTFRVSAKRPVTVESLAIEFPLKPEYATLWWPAEYVPSGPGGDAPRQPYTSDPINGMRVGDEEHGIQFAFETTRNWIVEPGKGQQLIPGDREYVVRFNLIGKPAKIEKPLEFSLGWQALPSRPRSPCWRRINADADWSGELKPEEYIPYLNRTGKLFHISPIYTEGWSRHWNYLNFWNEEVFEKDFIEQLKKGRQQSWETARNTLSMYVNVTTSDANTPEYRMYRFEWRPVPGEATYFPKDPATRNRAAPASVCVGSRSYTDFYMWCLDRTVRALSDDGKIPIHAYLDNSGMLSCSNYLHGCPKEGHTNLLAHREYMKRLYYIIKSVNPLNQILIHCSGDNRMSSWSFSDVMIEGEQMSAYYMSRLANDPTLPKNHTKLVTLAKARSQFQPLAYGPERMFLTQFWGWNKTEPHEAAPARAHLWGLMLVHDSPVWAGGNMPNIIKATEELGWDEKVEFIPYWRNQSGVSVTATARPVVASAWKRGNANLLVMVFNDSDTADQCQLHIDFRKFGFASGVVQSRDYGHGGLPYPDSAKPQEVRQSSIAQGHPILVAIGERSYRLLRFYQ